ncbi:hypothetical protein JNW88_18860 [Micromonospora sp. ATA32]|nr:hypothetical protein [Micromonospora sp. ATA32]
MALKLGELVAYLRTDNSQFRRGLDDGRRDLNRSGRDMQRDADATGRAMATALGAGGRAAGERFTRDASGRLRDGRGRFVADAGQLGHAAGQAASGGLASLRQAMDNLGSVATNIGSNVWNLTPMLSALAAGAVFAVPALYALGGAMGSLPALAAGGGAAVGTLALGFMGLSDAFKKTASSGAAAVDKSWQVAQAQRQLATSQREVLAAQEALTRAREDEVERLDDLNRALREAHLSEKEAALDEKDAQQRLADAKNAVQIAQDKLNQAKASGDVAAVQRATQDLLDAQKQQPDVIRRAELAYERAKLATESAKDSTSDLTKEQQRAARVGVEGSDQVRAALDRQRRAIEAVADAQHALAEAQKPAPGGGGAAGQMTKLAGSARDFVNVIKGLKPAFEDLRLDVQQRLFAGIGGEVKKLATAWLPQLHTSLGGMADTFNGIFKVFSSTAQKPEFIKNIGVGIESVRGLIDKLGKAMAGPGMEAFGKLSKAAKPFLDMLGDKLAGAVNSFSAWIDKADKSGKLTSFFETAAKYLGDIWDLGKDLGGVLAEFFSMWTDSENGAASKDLFQTIKDGVHDLKEWLSDPDNKENLKNFIDGFVTLASAAMYVLGWLVDDGIPAVWGAIDWLAGGIDWLIQKAGEAKDWIVKKWDQMVDFIKGLPKRISKVARSMFDGVVSAAKSAFNAVARAWNNSVGSLSFRAPSWAGPFAGKGWDVPDMPYLANGGNIVRAGLAMVGERGPEVLHLPAGAQVRPLSGGNAPVGGHTEVRVTGEILVRGDGILTGLRERIALGGGSVQAVLGSSH